MVTLDCEIQKAQRDLKNNLTELKGSPFYPVLHTLYARATLAVDSDHDYATVLKKLVSQSDKALKKLGKL